MSNSVFCESHSIRWTNFKMLSAFTLLIDVIAIRRAILINKYLREVFEEALQSYWNNI